MGRSWFRSHISALIVLVLLFYSARANPLRVLVLQSYHKADWSDSVFAGVRSVLDSVPGSEVYVEYMDTKRMETPAYLDGLDSLYTLKYKNARIEAVIAVDDQAYRFFLNRGGHIWGNIPMSFCGVNKFQDSAWLSKPIVTGVVEQGDFKANLEFARLARPKAKTIWIISDSTRTGLDNLEALQKELQNHSELDQRVLTTISVDSLKRALQSAPSTDFAFFIAFWKDPQGKTISPDTIAEVFRYSAIPVFGRSEWMIGKGMAGGMCVIGSRQGSLAAKKMLEQIAMKDSSRIPVLTDSPNDFLFDYRELERHQISMDILPVNAKVRFSPSTQLQISKDLFQYGSIAIGIVLLLLGLLLWINHRRLHLSRRLLAKEQDLRLLIETQSDLIVKVDMAGRFEFVSPSYCKLFQVPEEKLIGSTFQVRVHPDDLSSTMKAMEVLQAPPYKVYLEQRVILSDGIRWLGWNDSGITDNQGKLVAIIGVGRDITERKRLEVERERMIEELKRKNYELERYAYTVSHDLRSPLVTILGFAQEMELDLQAGDIGELQESLERIKSAGTRMHALLEAILQLSRIGHTTLDPKPLALSRAVEETLANLEGKIKESKASIILEPSADQWPEILGDYSRTVEVLQNLVENAMKYRLSDQMLVIRITAYVRATCVEVCIEDNGVGISSNNLEQIFQLFHKLDPKTPGVGFGLALCKQVMESLGGSIWAESDGLGKGARFWLRFPST